MKRFFLLFFGLFGLCLQAEQFIVENGQPKAQIVIAAENRPRSASLAALELQYHVQKMSGARIPIVTEPTTDIPTKIYVGKSPETEKLGVTDKDLKYGAYRIKSGQGWLVLLGDDRDFVPPFEPWPMKRNEVKKSEEVWAKAIEGKTDASWEFPFKAGFKWIWNPKDFENILDERYGQGSSALWKTGGNTVSGFWEKDENGSLNAVCDFLRGFGCRWYMPGQENEVIPQMSSIAIPAIDKTINPDFPIRAFSWNDFGSFPFDGMIWAKRIGIGSSYQKLGAMGGNHGLIQIHGNDKMKKAHPDYYALINGKRDTEHRDVGTPCLSSEGLISETVKYARFLFDEYKLPAVDVMPGDGFRICGCEKCKGKSASYLVWNFVNRVASEIYNTHPYGLITC